MFLFWVSICKLRKSIILVECVEFSLSLVLLLLDFTFTPISTYKSRTQIVPKCVTRLNASTYIEPIMTIFFAE